MRKQRTRAFAREAGEMTQGLRALIALAEDPNSLHSTHIGLLTTVVTPTLGDQMPYDLHRELHSHTYTYTYPHRDT